MNRRKSLETRPEFAHEVLGLVRELYPHLRARLSPDAGAITVGDSRFGLANVEAKYRLRGSSPEALRQVVQHHFNVVLAADAHELTGPISWGEAKPILMPQLMPESFLRQAVLAHLPFAPGLLVGLVIDATHGYRYVRADELGQWRVELPQAYAAALANLDAKSETLQIQAVLEGERLLAIQSNDGYDAVRVLLPRWRALAGDHLGYPFRFGIPNRDLLICWATDNSANTQRAFRAKIADDFQRQPYPLSRDVFEMDTEGRVRSLGQV